MEQHLMQNQQMASHRVGQLEVSLAQQRAIIDQMTQTASNKRMFDDTVQGPYNQLNIPAVDGKRGDWVFCRAGRLKSQRGEL